MAAKTHPGFSCNKFMNLHELKEWVKRRLSRKAKQAENAYVSEFTVKSTTNCLNHGIQLGENTWHCKINAMGLHEKGASQCWNGKARVCPLFELLRDVETLKRDFRKMRPNQLAIRWPSLGELIRLDHMLSLVEVESHEDVESKMYSGGNDQLSIPTDAEGVSSTDGDVHRKCGSGCSDSSTSNQAGIDAGGKSDAGGSVSGASYKKTMPMATFSRSRNGASAD